MQSLFLLYCFFYYFYCIMKLLFIYFNCFFMQMIRQSAIPSPNTRPLLDISAFVLKSSQCMPTTSSAAAVHAASGVSVDESLSLVRDAFGFLLLLSVVVCCCLLMY